MGWQKHVYDLLRKICANAMIHARLAFIVLVIIGKVSVVRLRNCKDGVKDAEVTILCGKRTIQKFRVPVREPGIGTLSRLCWVNRTTLR